jgi:tetratricopeptide (TPR) repeat protein
MTRLIILFLSLILLQCQSSLKEQDTDITICQTGSGEIIAEPSTVAMIERVKEAVSKIDVLNVPYVLNSKKAALILEEIPSAAGMQKTQLLFNYGNELMRSGRTEEAIEVIGEVLKAANQLNPETSSKNQQKAFIIYTVKKQLALAYMRKAEQDNCINNHTNESCIMPFSKKAQHLQREGSENAIQLLTELLDTNPYDYDCQYLLNVAHMTLGQYPNGVPEAYRIPKKYFQFSKDFPKFSDVAMDLGVDVNEMAGGTCIDDFNNDGYLDIFASSWGFENQIRFFENDKSGGFIEKTSSTGLTGVTGGLNLRHADYDNDGDLDLLVLRGAWLEENGNIPNSLIRNNGDGTFTDVTIESGLYSLKPTQTAVWADFNLDGWLDIFIGNESTAESLNKCELFMNNADGTFSEKAIEAGLTSQGFFKGVATGDLNGDNYPDIYLSNYLGENTLYFNTCESEGNVKFQQADRNIGTSMPYRSFSTWIFDYNNDGHEDIFVSGYSTDDKTAANIMIESIKTGNIENRPFLYRNNGDGSFTDVTTDSHLYEPVATMGCNFGDLDNDGFLDFYLATGDPELFSIVPNKMYRNNMGMTFDDVTYTGGFGHIQKGHAVGFGDLDMDGDQDIYAVMGGAFEGDIFQNILFENPIGNKNNWISILLEGQYSNRGGIGAKIILTVDDQGSRRKIYHTVGTGASFGGNSILAEIGLGKARIIERIEVVWPIIPKNVSVFENVGTNQVIKIKENSREFEKLPLKQLKFKKGEHHHQHSDIM